MFNIYGISYDTLQINHKSLYLLLLLITQWKSWILSLLPSCAIASGRVIATQNNRSKLSLNSFDYLLVFMKENQQLDPVCNLLTQAIAKRYCIVKKNSKLNRWFLYFTICIILVLPLLTDLILIIHFRFASIWIN